MTTNKATVWLVVALIGGLLLGALVVTVSNARQHHPSVVETQVVEAQRLVFTTNPSDGQNVTTSDAWEDKGVWFVKYRHKKDGVDREMIDITTDQDLKSGELIKRLKLTTLDTREPYQMFIIVRPSSPTPSAPPSTPATPK